jgi:uncharacterized membrane protein SpoIIM required for sporulation
MLKKFAADPWRKLPLDEARELDRLYLRASADLAKLATFSAAPDTRAWLENLVARGHAEIHGGRAGGRRLRLGRWLARTLPRTFRRHLRAFGLALVLMLGGAIFGGFAVALDPDAKEVIMPFSHLLGDPSERVAREESAGGAGDGGYQSTFAGMLMTHNIRVTIFAMALGMTWGAGTFALMFYNGVILGAVAVDYMLAGETVFLLGWLLPHGVVEIPAMLVGGQAGFVLAGALLGRGQRAGVAARLRAARERNTRRTGDERRCCQRRRGTRQWRPPRACSARADAGGRGVFASHRQSGDAAGGARGGLDGARRRVEHHRPAAACLRGLRGGCDASRVDSGVFCAGPGL